VPSILIAPYTGFKTQTQKSDISLPRKLFPRVLTEIGAVLWLLTEYRGSARGGKKANILPQFKKGKWHDPGNYRPVSLTSNTGKTVQQLIRDLINKE